MDKSDVEMEDAEKEPQGGSDGVKQSKDGVADAEMEPQAQEVASSPTPDHLNSPRIAPNNENHDLHPVLEEQQSNAQIEPHEETNVKTEVQELSNGKDENVDGHTSAQIEEVDQTNADTGAEDQNNAKAEAEDQPNVKSEMDTTDLQTAATEQNSLENGKDSGLVRAETKVEDEQGCENAEEENNHGQNGQLPFQLPVSEVPPKKKEVVIEASQSESEGMVKGLVDQSHKGETEDLVNELKESNNRSTLPDHASDEKVKVEEKTVAEVTKYEHSDTPLGNKRQPATPDLPLVKHSTPDLPVAKYSTTSSGGHIGQTMKNLFNEVKMTDSDDGTPEEQAAFMRELESFYRERGVDFKPPKFYGQPLNLLKLWRGVIRLGGYDRVTGSKLWRQVGESFHPPKTCTTVSWTFRIFYEKSLQEYEKYQRQTGELQIPVAALPEPSSVDSEGNGYQASGSGRARRDAAARAMQGWHAQRHFGYGEVGEPIIKDKNLNNTPKRESKVKSMGSLKQKRPNEVELPMKAQRTETSRQLTTTVVDVGSPADWVKINVRETKDSFEVYALVPGLLREEVRVQSDPAGRLVITGQPEQADNPWGITAFKKVVTLPARIDPLQTSAVVSLHGRLFVRVPFEQSNI